MKTKIVSYLRVSTARQGESGLGLDAQRAAVEAFCKRTSSTIAREFVEVESGRHDDRPKLAEALAFARRSKATLLVAKLDRLSRSVRFIASVMDSGVEFAAADMPDANRMLLHILAAIAEGEAKAISDRTKSALAAAKARGTNSGLITLRSLFSRCRQPVKAARWAPRLIVNRHRKPTKTWRPMR